MIEGAREWLTAAEAAAEQLPGFAYSYQHICRLIQSGEMASRPRKNALGRTAREFHWTSLPPEARAEYARRYGAHAEKALADKRARSVQKDLQAQARAQVIAAFADYRVVHQGTKAHALKSFCKAFAKRGLKLDDWIYTCLGTLQPHHVPEWLRKNRRAGTLLDGRGRPSSSGLFDRDLGLRNYAIAAIAGRPHLAATHLKSLIKTDLGRDIPLRTVQLFMQQFRNSSAPELKALTNPDRYRSHHRPAFGKITAERINARWEIDASPADAMCVVDGREFRVKLVGVIDVFTRRAMVLVSDQVRGLATMALLRRAILAWGLPELVKIDNGREFKNRAVERFCQDAGIETSFSKPFHPEEKPHIERFFGTLARDLFELLPGYIGHSVAERKGIEARKSFAHRFGEDANLCFGVQLTPEGLQARIDEWCERIYAETHHEGIALTPAHKALAHAHEARRLADERALDALMLDAPDAGGIRLVAKSGIRIGNRFYVAAELGAWMGHRIHCRFDPHETARIVVYSADRSRFICVAEDRERIAGADLAAVAQKAKALDRARIRDIRDAARTVQRLYPADTMADRLLGARTSPSASDAASSCADEDVRAPREIAPGAASLEAMRLASPPRLIAHTNALDALEAARTPEQPIEPTAEERDSAAVFFLEEAAKAAPAPDEIVRCEGYARPRFFGDECGLYAWLTEHRATLDAQDAKTLAEFERDETFQMLFASKQRRIACV